MDKLKTVNIKGKQYVEVSTRIVAFNENFENGRITTEMAYDGDYVRCSATVVPDVTKPEQYFTGHAEEDRTQGNINKTNATENCETSAVGRALAMMGIGIVDAVASADEVRHAVQKQETTKPKLSPAGPRKICQSCGEEFNPKPGTESYAKQCLPCFKDKKPLMTPKVDDYDERPPFEDIGL